MFAVDHRLAPTRPALPSVPSKKVILQPKLPDLGVQRLQVHASLGRRRRTAEHLGGSTQQLAAPLADLMRVNIVLVRDLGNRLAVAYIVERHLGLEGRRVVAAQSSAHDLCSC